MKFSDLPSLSVCKKLFNEYSILETDFLDYECVGIICKSDKSDFRYKISKHKNLEDAWKYLQNNKDIELFDLFFNNNFPFLLLHKYDYASELINGVFFYSNGPLSIRFLRVLKMVSFDTLTQNSNYDVTNQGIEGFSVFLKSIDKSNFIIYYNEIVSDIEPATWDRLFFVTKSFDEFKEKIESHDKILKVMDS